MTCYATKKSAFLQIASFCPRCTCTSNCLTFQWLSGHPSCRILIFNKTTSNMSPFFFWSLDHFQLPALQSLYTPLCLYCNNSCHEVCGLGLQRWHFRFTLVLLSWQWYCKLGWNRTPLHSFSGRLQCFLDAVH